MIDFSDKDYVINGSLVRNELVITFPDGDEETITETNMSSESMQLKQSICDEDRLKFGGCIASEFRIDLINTDDRIFTSDLVGKWISVKLTQYYVGDSDILPAETIYPSSTVYPGKEVKSKEFYIFSGYIDSAKVDTNDENMRNVVAYDVFAKLYEQDATSTLMSVLKSTDEGGYKWIKNVLAMCVNESCNKVLDIPCDWGTYFNEVINEVEELTAGQYKVNNDDWLADNNTISFGEIMKSVCEMLGLFGVIKPNGGKGYFYLLKLRTSVERYLFYENLYVEEFVCAGYTEIQILNGNENRDDKILLYQFPQGSDTVTTKTYDLTNNALAWQDWDGSGSGTSADAHLISLLKGDTGSRFNHPHYSPLNATLNGRPWVEVGDRISIVSYVTNVDGSYVYKDGEPTTKAVYTYALSRTLTGIQALTDKIEVKGT